MFYTSYFAKISALDVADIIPVAISRSTPSFYNGLSYTKLAPPWHIIKKYKEDGDWEAYKVEYDRLVLSKLDPHQVYAEIVKMVEEVTGPKGRDIALLCYERPGDHCHRQLVASWLNKNGILCKEYFN